MDNQDVGAVRELSHERRVNRTVAREPIDVWTVAACWANLVQDERRSLVSSGDGSRESSDVMARWDAVKTRWRIRRVRLS